MSNLEIHLKSRLGQKRASNVDNSQDVGNNKFEGDDDGR